MTYQASVIKAVVESRLRARGFCQDDDSNLAEMISRNIRNLRYGENVAVETDSEGNVYAVKKVDGFDCLHTIGEGAFIISYQELERYFHEQQSASVEL
jgi:hypothetical protein